MACENRIKCTCTYITCAHHGKCCECVAYHKRLGEAPGCLFSKEIEKTYDRSIQRLYEDHKRGR